MPQCFGQILATSTFKSKVYKVFAYQSNLLGDHLGDSLLALFI